MVTISSLNPYDSFINSILMKSKVVKEKDLLLSIFSIFFFHCIIPIERKNIKQKAKQTSTLQDLLPSLVTRSKFESN